MQFSLSELNHKSLEELKTLFSSIPPSESEVEIGGDFTKTLFGLSYVAQALSYIPPYISGVKFSGKYSYSSHSALEIEGTTSLLGGMETFIYRWQGYYNRELGPLLRSFVLSLPPTVNSLILNFERNSAFEVFDKWLEAKTSSVASCFKVIFQGLPDHISHVDLGQTDLRENYNELVDLYRSIPTSVATIRVGKLSLGTQSSTACKTIFSAFHSSLAVIGLNDNQLFRNKTAPLSLLFEGLPEKLHSLSLAANQLGRKPSAELHALFLGLPPYLKTLSLRKNELDALTSKSLSYAFTALSPLITELDLGDNGLLLKDGVELTTLLAGLPATIQVLRLCEQTLENISAEELKLRFVCLPSHIHTLSCSESNLFGLSIREFADTLLGIPTSITTLDLSGNKLNQYTPEDLAYLFSRIPPHVKQLKLHHNHLIALSESSLKVVFAALGPQIVKLDLRNNGFGQLLHTRLNQMLCALPDVVIDIEEQAHLGIRNDGELISLPHSPLHYHSLFAPQQSLRHQQQFAQLRLVMMQLLQSDRLCLDVVMHILSYLVPTSAQQALQIEKELTTPLISSTPPTLLTPALVQKSELAVRTRLNALTPDSTTLNLSHCGLNRLSQTTLTAFLKEIPQSITSLSLRGNGFQHNKSTKTLFMNALKAIPPQIKYLDLSEHGFEHLDATALELLLQNLPSTVKYISLTKERPANPVHQILMRQWPESYQDLVESSTNSMQQARQLLDDYIKGDSCFKRFLCGHWNLKHVAAVTKMVKYIDCGVITNLDDLLSEFERLEIPTNLVGSLGKRLALLLKKSLEPKPPVSLVQLNAV